MFIDPATVIYVEAKGKCSDIHCINKITYEQVSLTLKEVYKRLPGEMMYRIHNSFLVSRSYIVSMNSKKTRITCTNGIVISIGRKYQPDFLRRLNMQIEPLGKEASDMAADENVSSY